MAFPKYYRIAVYITFLSIATVTSQYYLFRPGLSHHRVRTVVQDKYADALTYKIASSDLATLACTLAFKGLVIIM